ncbi:MAG: hypothetical protein ABJF50_21750 [Paracoccaceae bacterium]
MKLAVLIRAHQFSAQEALLAERLEAAFKTSVIFVTDDTNGAVDTGRFAKIGIHKYRVRELIGGRILPQWGWQFGDVFYYAAAEALPHTTHFALIESDVYASPKGAERLAEVLMAGKEDILSPRLEHTDSPPTSSKDLDQLGLKNTVTSFFPITRVSRKALDLMQALRRRERETPRLRINDEAILASIALGPDVTSLNLTQSAPDLFDPEGFTTERTQLFEHLSEAHHGTALLHPVRTVKALLSRIDEFGGARNFRRRYREAIEQAAPRHRQKLRRALAAADERRKQRLG